MRKNMTEKVKEYIMNESLEQLSLGNNISLFEKAILFLDDFERIFNTYKDYQKDNLILPTLSTYYYPLEENYIEITWAIDKIRMGFIFENGNESSWCIVNSNIPTTVKAHGYFKDFIDWDSVIEFSISHMLKMCKTYTENQFIDEHI